MEIVSTTLPKRIFNRVNKPRVWLYSDTTVRVGDKVWHARRVGAAILNYTRYCRCGQCNSCLVGQAIVKRAHT